MDEESTTVGFSIRAITSQCFYMGVIIYPCPKLCSIERPQLAIDSDGWGLYIDINCR